MTWLARHAKPVLAVYSVLLFIVLFAPTPRLGVDAVSGGADILARLGLPSSLVTRSRVEFVENTLVVIPVAALGSLVWPRLGWRDWAAYGFVGALVVETVQGVMLPARSAQFADVVANALGISLGAVAVRLSRHS